MLVLKSSGIQNILMSIFIPLSIDDFLILSQERRRRGGAYFIGALLRVIIMLNKGENVHTFAPRGKLLERTFLFVEIAVYF